MKTTHYRQAILSMALVGTILGCGSRGWTPSDPQASAGGPAFSCEPGITRECVGPGACRGGQQCSDDERWGACQCSNPANAGGAPGQTSSAATGSVQSTSSYTTRTIAAAGFANHIGGGTSAAGTGTMPKGGSTSGGSSATKGGSTNAGGAGGTNTGAAPAQAGKGPGGSSSTGKGGSPTAGTNSGGFYPGGAGAGGSAIGGTTSSIPNLPPVISRVTVTPAAPMTEEIVTANVDATDPESDRIRYTYVWTVNGAAVGSNSSQLYGWSYFSRGDSIRVTVTPSDGKANGMSVTSDPVVVVNSPPTIGGSASIEPYGVASDDADLVCQLPYGTSDPDGDALTYKYRWYVNNVESTQTADTIPASITKTGDNWYCEVTVSDGVANATSYASGQTQVATTVNGIYRTDVTWTASKSPYSLTNGSVGGIQIGPGATLTVEPGVTIHGNGYWIQSWGNISMVGTKDHPIFVDSLWLGDNSKATDPEKYDFAYVQFTGGSLFGQSSNACATVQDCVFENLQQPIYITGPTTCTQLFQRNVFRYGYGIQAYSPTKLLNNVFFYVYYYSGPVVSVQDDLLANYNSFLSIYSPTLLSLGAKNADATNNYWGGLSDAEVKARIVDGNSSLYIDGFAQIDPTLTSAHADTPPPDKVYTP